MKIASISAIIVLIIGGLVGLGQLWFGFLTPTIFFKIVVSLGILLAVVVAIALIQREYISESKMRDDKFID